MKATEDTQAAYEYTTFPRRFVSYRWFKPLLVGVLTVVFMFVLQVVVLAFASVFAGNSNFISSIGEGYDNMDVYTGPSAMAELGGVAVLLPALALAALVVCDRPFSSYSSSRGGWNWSAFLKCLVVAVALMAAITIVQLVFFPEDGVTGEPRFTPLGLVVCAVLVPVQCVAEEYVFRGFILQTVGAWTKLPALAIVVSAAVFAIGHSYNAIGVVTIFINGVVWGALVWKTKGLEATSALHIVNNMIAFGFAGFGLSSITSEIDVTALAMDVFSCLAFAAIVVFADKKLGWFAPKRDGAAAFNQKVLERQMAS